MRVINANPVSSTNAAGGARRAGPSGAAFAAEAPGKPAQAAAPRASQAVYGIDALLVVQGVGDALSGRARAARRGTALLDVLEELRIDVLSGAVPAPRLARLVLLLRAQAEQSGDAGLDALLAQIELRARVELAKLGHADP